MRNPVSFSILVLRSSIFKSYQHALLSILLKDQSNNSADCAKGPSNTLSDRRISRSNRRATAHGYRRGDGISRCGDWASWANMNSCGPSRNRRLGNWARRADGDMCGCNDRSGGYCAGRAGGVGDCGDGWCYGLGKNAGTVSDGEGSGISDGIGDAIVSERRRRRTISSERRHCSSGVIYIRRHLSHCARNRKGHNGPSRD